MPDKNEKPRQNKTGLFNESMQRALTKVQGEMPGVKKVTASPREASFMSRIFMPRGANAITNPFTGNITANPEAMQDMSPTDIEQIMAHELTHTGQVQNTPWWKIAAEIMSRDEKVPLGATGPTGNEPYYWRPREMEAFQAERDRAVRQKIPNYVDPVHGTRDIQLRPELGPSASVRQKYAIR